MTYEFIPLLPFASFLILGLFGHWIKDKAHLVAVPAVVVSWLLSLLVFFDVAGGHQTSFPLYTWLTSGMLDIHIGFSIDRLTAVMLLLVTTVSSLVHIYTIGYMHGEPGYARFFSYIALFTFSMLMLVMADNLLQLFIFWEAVGLCSYLLIGHWYDRPAACSAATKAFIVNRVGDFGFMLGLLLVWYSFGSLDYHEMFARAHESAGDVMNVLGRSEEPGTSPCSHSSASYCSPAQSANRPKCRSTSGCRMRWKAPPPSRRSFMLRRWSRRACSWSRDWLRCITCLPSPWRSWRSPAE